MAQFLQWEFSIQCKILEHLSPSFNQRASDFCIPQRDLFKFSNHFTLSHPILLQEKPQHLSILQGLQQCFKRVINYSHYASVLVKEISDAGQTTAMFSIHSYPTISYTIYNMHDDSNVQFRPDHLKICLYCYSKGYTRKVTYKVKKLTLPH